MAFRDFPQQQDVVALLEHSLERGRLAHAYLFAGGQLAELEGVARTLAKTLNCEQPPRRSPGGTALDCCDACLSCRKIDHDNHPDVLWKRPESKSRQIRISQLVPRSDPDADPRPLTDLVFQKPVQARIKVGVIVSADRMNQNAANAFLKTLEEPPADSILILLSTEPQRLLETIVSRCLRLTFAGETGPQRNASMATWLASFSETAVAEQGSLLSRYRLLSVLLNKLNALKEETGKVLTQRSPLQQYDDLEPDLRERWEDELAAAIEAEYRRQRAEVLTGLQWWLRDVWLSALGQEPGALAFPQLASAAGAVARRVTPQQAMDNLRVVEDTQRLLATNVQEALALEVGLLKLSL
jgi:DNA polymerase III subunit delta'